MAETEETIATNDAAGWDVQDLLDHYTAAIQAYHTHANVYISGAVNLEWVKFNRVDINGHYIDPVTYINEFAAQSGGGGSTIQPANQVALAVSLLTAADRGPASKGRFYLPMPALKPDAATGLIGAANASQIAAQTKTFLELLSDAPGLDGPNDPGVVVMSRKAGAPMTRRVNGAGVGRVLDTQRRRRRNLVEGYSTTVIDQGTY